MKTVKNLLSNIPEYKSTGPITNKITSLTLDSRAVKQGSLFFAITGLHQDGHEFISQAIQNGAVAIVHSKKLDFHEPGVCFLQVRDVRKTMSPVAASFYDYPSKELPVVGITGTDGKSSTVYFLSQLMEMMGIKTGCISTVQLKTDTEFQKNPLRQSTPDAIDIQQNLRKMLDSGCKVAVLEATSHGLSPVNNRLGDVEFNCGIITNISHEHLEFHGSMEQYIDDKANLFRCVNKQNGLSIINFDEQHKNAFIQTAGKKIQQYSLTNSKADLYASDIKTAKGIHTFTVHEKNKTYSASLPIPGIFNIENALAAVIAAANISGETIETCVKHMHRLKPLTGRMHSIRKGQPFTALVDYAHSPGSFTKLFPIWRKEAHNKLITVFGSAGERDIEKRKIQGQIADTYSDIIILTDEDPRGEEAMAILEEIASGCTGKTKGKDLLLIPDRTEAIRKALKLAQQDDYCIFLGKGHESSIIYSDYSIEWNEIAVVEQQLGLLGYNAVNE